MKTIFLARQGVLVEGSGPHCTLRCGAAAGLRLLTELDFRLVVVDDAGAAGRLHGTCACAGPPPPSAHADKLQLQLQRQPGVATRARTLWRQAIFTDTLPVRVPPSPAISADEPIDNTGRRADNGQRRRRFDLAADVDRCCTHEEDDIATPDYEMLEHALAQGLVPELANELANTLGHKLAHTFTNCAEPGRMHEQDFARPFKPIVDEFGGGAIDNRAAPACRIRDRLGDLLFREQLTLLGHYCCRHRDTGMRNARVKDSRLPAIEAPCRFCRPPQPGLLLQAAFDHRIDLAASWLVGATLDEVEAGNRAGCRTVMIDNGSETLWRMGRGRVPTRIAPDLYGAARLIAEEGERP
jgi:hypothetical protein